MYTHVAATQYAVTSDIPVTETQTDTGISLAVTVCRRLW